MKKTSSKTLILAVFIMGIMLKPVMAYGAAIVPDTIRVGLRSAYSNKASIEIKSTKLEVGHDSNDKFSPQGTLISNSGFIIKPNAKQYYKSKERFYDYNGAAYSVQDYKKEGIGAVVAYDWPGVWSLYLEDDIDGADLVRTTGLEIMVQDGWGGDMLLCENTGVAPVFAGISSDQHFNLTQLSNGTYRGRFEFKRQVNTVTAINIVDYQDYLYGVIAAEMPASWHMEALKAQAVAARSMSIHQRNKYLKDGYNVCDTVYTQVYKGFTGETARTNQAVDETRGEVATYNGKVAETLFFSTSGGYTEDPQYVWGNPVPYLRSIPDPYEVQPEGKPWTRTITLGEIDRSLASQGIHIGSALGLRINEYTPAGRVNELEIMGSSGSHKLTRENIRTFFSSTSGGSLRSRMFTLNDSVASSGSNPLEDLVVYRGETPKYAIDANQKTVALGKTIVVEGQNGKITYGGSKSSDSQVAYGDIVISGQGYGHGVGMSQSGARGMADAGFTYDEIIEFYYHDVRVER